VDRMAPAVYTLYFIVAALVWHFGANYMLSSIYGKQWPGFSVWLRFVGMLAIGAVCTYSLSRQARRLELEYRTFLDDAPFPIFVHVAGRWIYANREAVWMLGASSVEQILDKPVFDVIHPDDVDEVRREIEWIMRTGAASKPLLERRMRTFDGREIVTALLARTIRYRGQTAIMSAHLDVTERKRAESQLAQAQRMLYDAEKLSALGQLAASVAHEIRNPLTALIGFTKLMPQAAPEDRARYCEIMESELQSIQAVVGEMLLFGKPQPITHGQLDVRKRLEESIALLHAQANMHSVEIVRQIGDEPLWTTGDSNQVKRVFINVMKNAIEAMQQGGRLFVRAFRHDGQVVVKFTDEGPGMTSEQLERIGSPFYSTKASGNGLGILICRRILEEHKGSLEIASKPGKGTTVVIRLPVPPEESR